MTDIFVPKEKLVHMLLCSFRYSLGQMTYIVSDCVEWLTLYWRIMPENLREQIQSNIRNAIEQDAAGMKCDVEQWKKILDLPVKDAAA